MPRERCGRGANRGDEANDIRRLGAADAESTRRLIVGVLRRPLLALQQPQSPVAPAFADDLKADARWRTREYTCQSALTMMQKFSVSSSRARHVVSDISNDLERQGQTGFELKVWSARETRACRDVLTIIRH